MYYRGWNNLKLGKDNWEDLVNPKIYVISFVASDLSDVSIDIEIL